MSVAALRLRFYVLIGSQRALVGCLGALFVVEHVPYYQCVPYIISARRSNSNPGWSRTFDFGTGLKQFVLKWLSIHWEAARITMLGALVGFMIRTTVCFMCS